MLDKIKQQIEEFINKANPDFRFVRKETAEVIQRAVKEIILGENGRDKSEFNSYLDLCFGSGNLSIHILEALDFFELDENNDLKIKDGKIVIFNDKNDFAYWKLENLVKGIQFIRQDVFEVVKDEDDEIEEFTFIEEIQTLLEENKDKKFDFITANFLIKSSDDDQRGAISFTKEKKERIEVLRKIFEDMLSNNGIFLFVKNSKNQRDLGQLINIFSEDAYYITIFKIPDLGQDLNLISKRPIIKERKEAKNE